MMPIDVRIQTPEPKRRTTMKTQMTILVALALVAAFLLGGFIRYYDGYTAGQLDERRGVSQARVDGSWFPGRKEKDGGE